MHVTEGSAISSLHHSISFHIDQLVRNVQMATRWTFNILKSSTVTLIFFSQNSFRRSMDYRQWETQLSATFLVCALYPYPHDYSGIIYHPLACRLCTYENVHCCMQLLHTIVAISTTSDDRNILYCLA